MIADVGGGIGRLRLIEDKVTVKIEFYGNNVYSALTQRRQSSGNSFQLCEVFNLIMILI